MNRFITPLTAAALVLVVTACGASSSAASATVRVSTPAATETSPRASATADAAEETSTEVPATTAQVQIENFAYVPARIEVPTGTTVTWSNGDTARHTVTSGDGDAPDGRFGSDRFAAGAAFSVTFDAPGTYAYFCDIHPTMTGVVVVGP